MDHARQNPAISIVGPTGSGKSELALRLAGRFDGEIVSCDSVQIYRYFNIGSAKLSIEERRGIPHHLIDAMEPDQVFSAGDYARAGRSVMREIAARGRLPIIVGGTGFYLRALLDGLSATPARDSQLRDRLMAREGKRKGSLHRILSRLDPAAASRIHPNDVNKVLRALELRLLRNAPGTTLAPPDPLTEFHVVKVGLNPDRELLYERLNARLRKMFEAGLVAETAELLRMVSPEAKPFESLGYKQALQYLRGQLSIEDAIAAAQQATRQYAKRQLTWFRREAGVLWFERFGDDMYFHPISGTEFTPPRNSR